MRIGWVATAKLLSAAMNDNLIADNSADYSGGLHLRFWGNVTLDGNAIVSNSALYGGGLYTENSALGLRGTTVASNAAHSGGGMYVAAFRDRGWSVNCQPVVLTNGVLADNWADSGGSGIFIDTCAVSLLHTTVARNVGGDGSGISIVGTKNVGH
jgi:hypothetical protein